MAEEHPPASKPTFAPPDPLLLLMLLLGLPAILVQATFNAAKEVRQGDTALFWLALGVGILGCVLLLIARWPLYRQRIYLTVGSVALPKRSRVLYKIAYTLILPAIVALLFIWIALR
jgi:hypothetical protein